MNKHEIIADMVIAFDIIQKIVKETEGQNEKLTNLLTQAELGIWDAVYVIEDELFVK
jgi:hypothetical protein